MTCVPLLSCRFLSSLLITFLIRPLHRPLAGAITVVTRTCTYPKQDTPTLVEATQVDMEADMAGIVTGMVEDGAAVAEVVAMEVVAEEGARV